MDSKAVVTVRTNDGEKFEVEMETAAMFGTVKRVVEDGCVGEIPLPSIFVTGESFRKALKWAARHADAAAVTKEELQNWDAKFAGETEDMDELYRDLMAADYLDAAALVDLWAERAASEMRGKNYKQIRERFNIISDFPPGVEEDIIGKNPWAFE